METERKKKIGVVVWRAVVIGVLLVGGCAVSGPKRPDWVKKGAGAFPQEKSFYGVGAVSGIANVPLAIRAAQNQARADIAKQFEVYSASLMRQYAASTTAGDMTQSAEEQHVEEAVKTFSAVTLSGMQIVDGYEETGKDGVVTVWALAKLDLAKFKEAIDQAGELSAGVRDFVRKNAEKSFDALGREEEARKRP